MSVCVRVWVDVTFVVHNARYSSRSSVVGVSERDRRRKARDMRHVLCSPDPQHPPYGSLQGTLWIWALWRGGLNTVDWSKVWNMEYNKHKIGSMMFFYELKTTIIIISTCTAVSLSQFIFILIDCHQHTHSCHLCMYKKWHHYKGYITWVRWM